MTAWTQPVCVPRPLDASGVSPMVWPRLRHRPKLTILSMLLTALGPNAAAHADDTRPDFQTVVRAPRSDVRPGEWTLRTQDAQSLAGSLGDPLRAIDSAAAVARPALGSGAVTIWGSAPADSRVLILGMELPMLYHLGGLRGVLPAAMVQDVTLSPAAFAAEYGRATGGLIVLSPRTIADGVHAEVAADLLDASATLSAQLGSRLQVAVAGRYSYLDRALSALSRPDLGDFFPLPQYLDAQAQLAVQLSKGHSLNALFLASRDTLKRAHASGDASRAQHETWQQSFYRLGLQYEQQKASGASLQITPWIGVDEKDYEASFGSTPAQQRQADLLYGLRSRYSAPVANGSLSVAWQVGVDLRGQRSELEQQGTLTRPAREGDRWVFGQRPSMEVNADSWSVHSVDLALFASVPLRWRWLRIDPGIRLSGTLTDVSRLLPRVGDTPPLGSRELAFAIEPRLHIRAQIRPQLAWIAAVGLHHQPPAAADQSAVFGSPALRPQRATHGSLALDFALRERVQLEGAAFVRWLDQQVTRSPLVTPPLAGALSQDGSGYAVGGQLVLRLHALALRHVTLGGWLSYSLSRSQRRDSGQARFRPFAWDQTHGLQAALQVRVLGIGTSLRVRYATGQPRTPVVGSYYNAWADQYEPLLGAVYSTRLPDFVQLDLRVEYTLRWPAQLRWTMQLDVQNLSHRQNVEELAYSHDFSAVEPIFGLPILAVAGLRIAR